MATVLARLEEAASLRRLRPMPGVVERLDTLLAAIDRGVPPGGATAR